MLAKGIIKSIDLSGNTCVVRVPLFETAGNEYKSENEGIFAIPPGIFNNYNVNDVVIVGFDADKEGAPIVIGKLYKGASDEANVLGGAVQCTNLVVSTSATLPADTKINFEPDSSITNAEVALTNYKSLNDITTAISNNSSAINKLKTEKYYTRYLTAEQCAGSWIDNTPLYKKTIVYDFVANNIGQTPQVSWSASIDISDINFNLISELHSFITTTISSLTGRSYACVINTANKTINLSGLNGSYTLNKFYITLQYTKN